MKNLYLMHIGLDAQKFGYERNIKDFIENIVCAMFVTSLYQKIEIQIAQEQILFSQYVLL